MSDDKTVWSVLIENHIAGIRMLHTERTEYLEDAIWAARDRMKQALTDKSVSDVVAGNACLMMYARVPERRPAHLFETGKIFDPAPLRTLPVESHQKPDLSITEPLASNASASRLLMLLRDQYATEGEKAQLQAMIDRLTPASELPTQPSDVGSDKDASEPQEGLTDDGKTSESHEPA